METAAQAESQGWEALAQKVWAGLDMLGRSQAETDRQMKEAGRRMQETERLLKELFAETALQIKETALQMQETDWRLKETGRRIDKLSNTIDGWRFFHDDPIENLISARFWEKFANYPYTLQRAYPHMPVYDDNNRVLTDIDILLSDESYAMAVEVKEELDRKDNVEYHVRRMGIIKQYPPASVKGKLLLGAMAGGEV
ncbi:MAG: hypothetical protein LBS00_10425, partial [Synergistaceae bacterium]|nr:hypothetical protein [Synergistaceae bacterium]